jgi:hypothetical protein
LSISSERIAHVFDRLAAWNGPAAPAIKRRYRTIERAWDVLGPVPLLRLRK